MVSAHLLPLPSHPLIPPLLPSFPPSISTSSPPFTPFLPPYLLTTYLHLPPPSLYSLSPSLPSHHPLPSSLPSSLSLPPSLPPSLPLSLPPSLPPSLDMHQYVEDGEDLPQFYNMYESLPPGHMDLATRWNDLSQTLLFRWALYVYRDLVYHIKGCSIDVHVHAV